MDHVAAVDVLDAAEDLVHEVLHVVAAERLPCLYDLVQVGVHELRHDVDVLEGAHLYRRQDVEDGDDVFVLHYAENLPASCLGFRLAPAHWRCIYLCLSKCALGIQKMIENATDFLDRHCVSRDSISRAAAYFRHNRDDRFLFFKTTYQTTP